jgi:hypothetical protein
VAMGGGPAKEPKCELRLVAVMRRFNQGGPSTDGSPKGAITMQCELCEKEIDKGANWVQVTFGGMLARFHWICWMTNAEKAIRSRAGERAQVAR